MRTPQAPTELSVQAEERRQIEELESEVDHEALPIGRDNPDFQNTNILRSAFPNASTQGWGMVALSAISRSENSMPIDLLVRADFERWVREEKKLRAVKNYPNQILLQVLMNIFKFIIISLLTPLKQLKRKFKRGITEVH